MKKYLSLMAFAMMAVFSLAFVSCGDDDEEDFEAKSEFQYYLPLSILESDSFYLSGALEKNLNGTKYYLNKNYTVENKKRKFTKIPVLYTSRYEIEFECDGVLFDKYGDKIFPVFLV